jgi:hypothetical protein
MYKHLLSLLNRRNIIILVLLVGIFILISTATSKSLTFNPETEEAKMQNLKKTKQSHELSEFTSDGCSGAVSQNWSLVVGKISELSPEFADKYKNELNVPFESSCMRHDLAYHRGLDGYQGRLQADNTLRGDIITYGIENASEIQARVGLNSPAKAMFLYEKIADAIYLSVRVGGAPCTGKAYAWGYGYNEGFCVLD